MTNPITTTVEIAFSDGPAVASPTWTDVSADVSMTAGIQFNRGRGETSTAPEPGRLSLSLNNDDGTYTWGKVGTTTALGRGDKPPLRQPIRVTFTYSATDTVVWTGYIDEWSQEFTGTRPRVRVTASDRLAKLALLNLDDGAIRSEVLYDSPVAYYPMNEEAGFVSAGDQSGNLNGSLAQYSAGAGVGTVDFGAGSTPDGVGTCAAVTNTSGMNGKYLRSELIGGGFSDAALTLESWVRTTGGVATIAAVSQHPNTSTTAWLIIAAGNVARGGYADLLSPSAYVDSPGTINDGAWHHLALVKSGTGVELYLDGASVGTDSGAATGYNLGAAFVAGAAGNYHLDTLLMQDGQVAHFAVYDTALAADRILQHYSAGKSAGSFYGEAAADRFDRLCRLSGLPAAAYATDATATTTVGAQNLAGVGMLDAIQQVTDSERGVAYLSGDGVLTYKSTVRLESQAVGATVTNSDVEGDLRLLVNDQTVVNDVTVTRVGGATQRRADALSQATMGVTNATTVDTLLTTDAEAGALADLLLSQGTCVQPRTGDLTIDLVTRAATVDVNALLALDTGSRVRVTGLPVSFPADALDLEVRGVAVNATANECKLTLTVVPALTVEPWLLDDATYSVLDRTTRLGYYDTETEATALLRSATWYIDATGYTTADAQTVQNLGTGGSTLNAQVGSGTGVDANDPTFLPFTGMPYVYLPGVASNTLAVPSFTTGASNQYDFAFRVALSDWTPASETTLWGYTGTGDPNRSVRLAVQTGGTLRAEITPTGSLASYIALTSSAAVPFTDGQAGWLRVTIDGNVAGSYEVKFYTAADSAAIPSSWTQLGVTRSGAGFTWATTTAAWATAGGAIPLEGRVYRIVQSLTIGGSAVLDVDTSVITSGAATSFTATTGQTVTIGRATTGKKACAVVAPVWLFGTDDYMEVADSADLDFAAAESFTVLAVVRSWATFGTSDALVAKKANTTATTQGWALSAGASTAAQGQLQAGDGAAGTTAVSGSRTSGALAVVVGVRDVTGDVLTTYLNGTAGTPVTDATTGTLANAEVMRVGRLSGAGTEYTDGEIVAAAVFRSALSSTDITTLTAYFQSRVP